jgi:asparagine synthase (glutamine-hydrolysing)
MMRDKISSHFFVENRYPFLDKRLVEFCYAIPTEIKFKFGWSRYILRISMLGILPSENQWRISKANLNPIYKTNMLSLDKHILEEIIASENSTINNYVDMKVFQELYKKFTKGVEISDSAYSIYLVSQLYLWLNLNHFKK